MTQFRRSQRAAHGALEVELHPCTAISRSAGQAEWSKSVADMASGGDGGIVMVNLEEF